MSDDLRDKFGSDEDYEDFRKSYGDYKNKTGMFDQKKQAEEYIKMVIKIEEMIYKNFVLEKKKYFRLPDEFFNIKYVSSYMFYFEKLLDFPETTILYMN